MRMPDLSQFPTALEKASFLLETAAEVEHALMVQYLYAVYSLRASSDFTDAAQRQAISRWRMDVLGIAKEEMGHLLSVQNLLLSIGLAPNLEREDFPPRHELYPFLLHLEPLSRRSLAKYVFAESPPKVPAGAEAAFVEIEQLLQLENVSVNHVGVIYTLLGVVFSGAADLPTLIGQETDPGRKTYLQAVAELRSLLVPAGQEAAWLLEPAAFGNPLGRQAEAFDWSASDSPSGGNIRVFKVTNGASAMLSLSDIAAQGEGPGGTTEGDAHFARFFRIFAGQPPFPAPEDTWQPSRPVAIDPLLPGQEGAPERIISHPLAAGFARAANAGYAVLLALIEHYLLTNRADRDIFATSAIEGEMLTRLAGARKELAALPRTAEGADQASLPFHMPATLHLPTEEVARGEALRERYRAGLIVFGDLRQLLAAAGKPTDSVDRWIEDYTRDLAAV